MLALKCFEFKYYGAKQDIGEGHEKKREEIASIGWLLFWD